MIDGVKFKSRVLQIARAAAQMRKCKDH